MYRKITSFLVAVSVLVLMQVADCQAMSLDSQAMHCCRTMPCHPASRAHDCCKKMVSPQTWTTLPSVHIPDSAPLAIVTDHLPVADVFQTARIFCPFIEPLEHSPPDL